MKRNLNTSAGATRCMVCLIAVVFLGGVAFAQQAGESEKIEPYTGPPIFLDEPQQVAAPTMVRREAVPPEKYDDGTVRVEREVALFSDNHIEADGKYREYYPNGKPFVEGQFRRGRQHGEWTYFHDNGQINRKAKFDDGQPDGPREIYRADGTLAAKRNFQKGTRHGEWVTYDKTGKQPLREEHYDSGKPDGVWKTWHSNGQIKQQISFKQGERDGTSIEWDEKGNKLAEVNYTAGKLNGAVARWFPDGRKIVQQYEDGKLVSQSSE